MRFSRTFLHCVSLLIALAATCSGFAQTFANPKVIPTGNWPAAVYSTDVNGDGYPDLIYIDQGATPVNTLPTPSMTHVLLGDGKGGFTQSAEVATSGNCLAVADMDGDGHPDLIWLSSSSVAPTGVLYIAVYARGKGDGTFAAAYTYGSVLEPYQATSLGYLVAGHITKTTGPLDLAFENTVNSNLFVMLANSPQSPNGTANRTLAGSGPITLADLNGDGYEDIIIQQGTASAAVYLSSGSSGLALNPRSTTTGASGVRSLLIQDVNYDGRPDLIAEGAAGHIDVFFGNGDGTFQTTSSGGTGPVDGLTGNGGQLIATGDFNHDGLLDALTATPLGVSTLLGQGTEYLGLKGIYNAGPAVDLPNTIYAIADFNHDGNLDFALPSPEGIAILYGNADGSFQSSQAFAAGQPAMSGGVGAFTSSGNIDAVVSTSTMQAQLLRGKGDGTFVATSTPTSSQPGTTGLWSVVKVADLNSDGTLDLLLTGDGPTAAIPTTSTGIQVQLGDGAGGFAAPYPFSILPSSGCSNSPGLFYGTSALGENLLGATIANRDLIGVGLVYNGNHNPPDGSGFYNTSIDGTAPCGPYAHNLAISEIFTPRSSFNEVVTDIIAQSDGHLYLFPAYNPSGVLSSPTGDLSSNGSLTTPGQATAPALSHTFNGPAIPAASGGLGFPAFIGSAVAADLDRDGSQDLIVVYANLSANLQTPIAAVPNNIYIWFGTSATRNFPASIAHPVNPVVLTPSRNFYQVAVADMNGDGIPDLVLSDGYILSVQLGKGDGSFGAETHYLAGQGINTISIADVNHDGKPDLVLANGGAVLTNPVANLEKLATNPDVNTGGVTVLLNSAVMLPSPAGTVTASPEPSVYGSAFSLVLTFTSTSPAPTGSVTFSVDGTVVGTTTILGINPAGVIYAAPNSLAGGAHVITAAYSGDSSYSAATFTGTHAVTTPLGGVIASPEPSIYGDSFTLTGTAIRPGQFVFSVDGAPVGTVTSSTSSATVVVPGTYVVGTHNIALAWTEPGNSLVSRYTGTHQVVQNPTTLSLLLCVDPPGSQFPCGNPLSATPLISPISFFYGQSVDGVATESATNLGGNIIFYDNTNVFCTISADLSGGSNICPPQSGYFNAGNYTVYAKYTGDPNNSASTSNQIQVNVFADTTTAKLTSSSNPAVVGSNVTFTYAIAGNFATPTGTITFYNGSPFSGSNLIGSVALDATGTATISTANLAVGTYTIYAVYNSNPNFNAIQSSITQVITPAAVIPPPTGTGFTLTVTPDPVTVGAGATGILLVKVTGQSSQTPQVSLSCSGLPEETTCIFVTATLPAGGGATTLQLHLTAPHDCGSTAPYFIGSESGPASPVPYTFAAVLLGSLAVYRRRKVSPKVTLLLMLIALVSLASLSGCGHCTDLGTRPGSYTFTVTATPVGTSTSGAQSVTIPLRVTIPGD